MSTYMVRRGDTPASIARYFTGNPARANELVSYNMHKPRVGRTFAHLHVGEHLQLPARWGVGLGGPNPPPPLCASKYARQTPSGQCIPISPHSMGHGDLGQPAPGGIPRPPHVWPPRQPQPPVHGHLGQRPAPGGIPRPPHVWPKRQPQPPVHGFLHRGGGGGHGGGGRGGGNPLMGGGGGGRPGFVPNPRPSPGPNPRPGVLPGPGPRPGVLPGPGPRPSPPSPPGPGPGPGPHGGGGGGGGGHGHPGHPPPRPGRFFRFGRFVDFGDWWILPDIMWIGQTATCSSWVPVLDPPDRIRQQIAQAAAAGVTDTFVVSYGGGLYAINGQQVSMCLGFGGGYGIAI